MTTKRKSSNKYKNQISEQLFTLFKKISYYIPDEDEFSTVIGYSIIDSLKDFRTDSGSTDEIKFQEVKKVYETLNEIVESYNKGDNYHALFEIKSRIDPFIKNSSSYLESTLSNGKNEERKSILLNDILSGRLLTLRKNYIDILRRSGKKLYDEVLNRGPLNRTIDILTNDYQAINDNFK